MFREVPDAGRLTLVQCSVFPRFTADMAIALTANPEIAALLETLYRLHLFVERRYGAEISYQFHVLYRAFLRDQARRCHRPAALADLAGRAATLLERSGSCEDALISRLRKLLGHDTVVLSRGKISLDPRLCWVDLASFRDVCTAVAAGLRDGAAARLVRLHGGPFLQHERDQPWMLGVRDDVRARLARTVWTLASAVDAEGLRDEAAALRSEMARTAPLA